MNNKELIDRVIYLNDLLDEGNLTEELLSSIHNEITELTEELKSLS
jgi:hypothetical protein